MPVECTSSERYVMCNTNSFNEENKSMSSEHSISIMFKDQDYVDLAGRKCVTGNIPATSHSLSSTITDRWGSYWSKRERCCCFWNFILTVTIAILVTLLILSAKGVVILTFANRTDAYNANKESVSFEVTQACTTQKPITETCNDEMCIQTSVELLSKMNISADPCLEFYEYACGSYSAKTKLSWNSPRKRIIPEVVTQEHYQRILDGLSEEINDGDTTDVKTLKTIFKSCIHHTDTPLKQVQDIVDSLGGFDFMTTISKTVDINQLLADVTTRFGVSPLFEMTVQPDNNISIYNRFSDTSIEELNAHEQSINRFRFLRPSDFIYRNEKTDELLLAYKAFIGDFIAYIIGIKSTTRSERSFLDMIDDIYHLDVFINRVFYSEDVTNLSYETSKCSTQMTTDALQYHFNYNISWRDYFHILLKQSSVSSNYTICYVSLSQAVTEVLSGFSSLTLKRYVIFYTLTQSDIFFVLPKPCPTFDLIEWERSALKPNVFNMSELTCARQMSTYLPMHALIANEISSQTDKIMYKLFLELISSIEGLIRDLYWVPNTQKQHLIKVLNGLNMHTEWKTWNDSLTKELNCSSEDYLKNLANMIRYKTRNNFLGKARLISGEDSIFVLKGKTMYVPLKALQIPFLYASNVPSLWYGSVGTFMSQIIAQLFDIDALLRYLSDDRIDQRLALTIATRLQCLLEEYNKYTLLPDFRVRGDLTKSANFKDSMALRIAYYAYKNNGRTEQFFNIPGLSVTSDMMFFLAYAQSMCEHTSVKGTFKYYINTEKPHQSPGRYRVIGTLSHYRKFSEAFNCPPNSYMNPENKCSLFN